MLHTEAVEGTTIQLLKELFFIFGVGVRLRAEIDALYSCARWENLLGNRENLSAFPKKLYLCNAKRKVFIQ